MSYDFAVLLPEIVGPDDADALTAAIAVFVIGVHWLAGRVTGALSRS